MKILGIGYSSTWLYGTSAGLFLSMLIVGANTLMGAPLASVYLTLGTTTVLLFALGYMESRKETAKSA